MGVFVDLPHPIETCKRSYNRYLHGLGLFQANPSIDGGIRVELYNDYTLLWQANIPSVELAFLESIDTRDFQTLRASILSLRRPLPTQSDPIVFAKDN